jgi:hypothetical protein
VKRSIQEWVEPGESFEMWTEPRRDADGDVVFRKDGSPHEPRWGEGDEVVL